MLPALFCQSRPGPPSLLEQRCCFIGVLGAGGGLFPFCCATYLAPLWGLATRSSVVSVAVLLRCTSITSSVHWVFGLRKCAYGCILLHSLSLGFAPVCIRLVMRELLLPGRPYKRTDSHLCF